MILVPLEKLVGDPVDGAGRMDLCPRVAHEHFEVRVSGVFAVKLLTSNEAVIGVVLCHLVEHAVPVG